MFKDGVVALICNGLIKWKCMLTSGGVTAMEFETMREAVSNRVSMDGNDPQQKPEKPANLTTNDILGELQPSNLPK